MRKLNLTELEEELEVLQAERLSYIKGGEDTFDGGYLPEVTIIHYTGGTQNPFSWFNWWNGYYSGGGDGNEDPYGSGGYSSGYSNSGDSPTQIDFGLSKGFNFPDYSIFIDGHNNNFPVILPGVQLSNEWVTNGDAYQLNGTIHIGFDANAALVQHEYGHYLQQQNGNFTYLAVYVPWSVMDAMLAKVTDWVNHNNFSVEILANQLAVEFFGPSSDIANDPAYPKQ